MDRTGDAWQGTSSRFAASASGDAAATFMDAFTRLAPHLYDFLARLSGRTEAADALLRQAASQAAMGASSGTQWPSERAWFFSRAFAVIPGESNASDTDLASFTALDAARLPGGGEGDAARELARAVWRAVSALPNDQHALLHLHVREGMVAGEAASVLGITEREANDQLTRLTAATEETSRALFLLRHGRTYDATLNDLLTGRNVTRLTPELRAFLNDYAHTSPSVRAMLAAVPPPLTVYAAFRTLPLPSTLAAEATESALPWLATGGAAGGAVDALTRVLPEQDATTAFDATDTVVNNAYPYGATAPTDITGVIPESHAAPYGQTPAAQYGTSPPPDSMTGTQMLDIPVRQRIVTERTVTTAPPPRSVRKGPPPAAIIGGLALAVLVIVGGLVAFLTGQGSGGTAARATATIGGTGTAAIATTAITAVPDVLLTSTALAANRFLTVTALAATPTPVPTVTVAVMVTATPAPQPVVRPGAPEMSGTPVATSEISPAATTVATAFVVPTPLPPLIEPPPPLITAIPTPIPRITVAPTVAGRATVAISTIAPTPRAVTAATTPSVTTPAATVAGTARATTGATAAATAATRAATAATTAAATPATPATTATRAATTATTPAAMPTGAATTTGMGAASVSASSSAINAGTNASGSVTLSNKGGATNFTTSPSRKEITVSPASGTIGANGSAPLTITINRAGLMPGSYNGSVLVNSGGGTITILVSFTV